MNIFYIPELTTETVVLDEDESKHAIRVLRLKKGDEVVLVDGKGTRATAVVSDDHPKRCFLQLLDKHSENTGRNFELHIAIAPTKNSDRLEWFV
ncbi:MAG TPA: RNA methyltransferase PUA domain-containing protein, partial [Bacteroidia bacterium]|nr:RNA methyltransferase PUA domain-containing protein [Bacteroidia bacterium]